MSRPGAGQPDPHGQDWLILTSPAGGPMLAFQKVGELPGATWPDGPVPQQLHLGVSAGARENSLADDDEQSVGGQGSGDGSDGSQDQP
jgi:hypothetical protein